MSIAIFLCGALRKYCNALRCETLFIPSFDSGYDASRVGGPTVLHILDWRYVNDCFLRPSDVDHVTRFQGSHLHEVRNNARPRFPATHFPHRLFVNVQFALVVLQSTLYVIVVFRAQSFVAD